MATRPKVGSSSPFITPVTTGALAAIPTVLAPPNTPITPQRLKNATTDPGTLDVWWSRCPNANIGIVTGRVSGIVVEDVDAKSGGLETWAKLRDIQGRVDTLTAVTGVGGGYIVAPSSVHISGDRYGRA